MPGPVDASHGYTNDKSTRWPWLLIGVAVLLAFAVRVWGIRQAGLTQYDEGVYALSGFWALNHGTESALYPWQKLFSPPGYFGLVGIVNWFAGRASDTNAIAINVVLGSLTVLAAFWAGRKSFGEAAGISAAVLVGFSEFHIAFSKSGLADTGFGLLFLASLALIAICFEKERLILALPAGLAIGGAWNMKYHGWLLLALSFLVAVVRAVHLRSDPMRVRKLFRCWIVMCSVAVVSFLPWLLYIELHLGGYAEINQFHGRFLNFRWAHNLRLQAGMQLYFDGWLSRVSPSIAFLSAAVCTPKVRFSRGTGFLVVFVLLALLLAGTLAGGTTICLLLASMALPFVWKSHSIFGSLLVATLFLFFILVPCYKPFARLLLPWSMASMMLAGVAMKGFLESRFTSKLSEQILTLAPRKVAACLACAAILVGLVMHGVKRSGPRTWESRSNAREAASQILNSIPMNGVIFVFGEPEMAFYFKEAGRTTFCVCLDPPTYHRVEAIHPFLFDPKSPVYYVADSAYAKREWNWPPAPVNSISPYQVVARLTSPPSDIRLLDDFPGKKAGAPLGSQSSEYEIVLYKETSPESISLQTTAP